MRGGRNPAFPVISVAMSANLELSVVVPTFNEAGNVEELLGHLRRVPGEVWAVLLMLALGRALTRIRPRLPPAVGRD